MNASIDETKIGYTKEGKVFMSILITGENGQQNNILFQWEPAVGKKFAEKIIEAAVKAEEGVINVGNCANFN